MKRFEIFISLLVIGVVSFVAIWDGCYGAVSWTSDSLQYIRCAENLKSVLSGGAWCGEWFAVWPIGYPALIACVSGIFRMDAFVASKVLGILMTAGLLFVFYRCFRSCFVLLALSLLNLAYLKIFRGTLSEHVFIPLLVLLFCAPRNVLSLTALFVSLFLVRYVGLFAPIWYITGLVLSRQRDVSVWRKTLMASVIAWLIEGVYLSMNKVLCGAFTGITRIPKDANITEFMNGMAVAEFHEIQAFGLVVFWGLLLLLVCGGLFTPRDRSQTDCHVLSDKVFWLFVGGGIAYHITMLCMRALGSCSELGYRFLYPGTLLLVVAVCVKVALLPPNAGFKRIEWKRSLLILVVTVFVGINLLGWELDLRRCIGIPVYDIGRPYLDVKREFIEKYKDMPTGGKIHLKGLHDENLPIIYFRSDCDFDFPPNVRRY